MISIDCLEICIGLKDSSLYWLAPFIQKILYDLIKKKPTAIAIKIEDKDAIDLE